MKFSPSIGPVNAGIITVYQGASFNKPFYWSIIDGETQERIPVDLTGAEIRMQLRTRVDGPVIVDFLESGYIYITDPEKGGWEISISAEDTALLDFRSGVFDIEVKFPEGTVTRIVSGTLVLDKEVTK